jgi:hypothetical protein
MCRFQAFMYQFHIGFGCAYAGRRFFLEAVQHINRFLKSHRIGHAVSIAANVLDNLKHARPFALPGFADSGAPPNCTTPSAKPKSSTASPGKASKSLLADPTQ